jgi:O-antigen ligase
MSLLLAGLMAVVIGQQLFALPLSLGPGLSIENAFLYVVAGALALKFAVLRNLRYELHGLHVCFALLIGYAALSIPFVTLAAPFDSYKPLPAILSFKASLLDQFVFFAVFFYGLHNTSSALNVLKALLAMTAIANLFALFDAWGFIDLAGLVDRFDGRAQGVMGESNQSAAFIAAFLPGLVAMAFMSKGLRRLAWIGGLMVTAVAMTISASRGGFVALLAATIWGLACFRRFVSGRSIVIGAVVGVAILLVVLPFVASKYGFLLAQRLVEDSTNSNLAGISSGRLDIWATAFARMMESPLSLITGFGWNAYDAMPFRYNTHNHYLTLWFDLGLVGLICGTGLLVLSTKIAMRAVPRAAAAYRPSLIAFAMGAFAIAVAAFFVNLYTPWLWFWAYAGLAMRIAANAFRQHAAASDATRSDAAPAQSKKDPFGWLGSTAPGAGR